MKFKCYVRTKNNPRQLIELDALNRHDAIIKLKNKKLSLIEIVEHNKKQKPVIFKDNNIYYQKNSTQTNKLVDEIVIYKQREHSYILGVLLGPLGFIIAALIWRLRGVKYGLCGLGMGIVVYFLLLICGFIGWLCGVVLCILIERMIIPKPNKNKME